MLTLASLFDGIGGWLIAAHRNGIKPVWSSEIEDFPMKVSKAHFPDVEQLGDVTKINGGEVPPVDIICAGSPCQDLSVAGKQEGLAGSRSNLFFESVRIVREMREATNGIYPKFFVWENVTGAFSSNHGHDFQAVLGEITQTDIPMSGSGRWSKAGMVRGKRVGCAWRVLDAQYWGVPQHRERIFLVAGFGKWGGAVEVLFKPESVRRDSAESESKGQDTSTGTVPCAFGTGRGVCQHGDAEKPSKLLTLRSGCEGGGKGPLVQDELSGTLNTHNTQTLFCKSPDAAFIGNLQVDSTKVKNTAGALNCMHQVGCVMVRGGRPCIYQNTTGALNYGDWKGVSNQYVSQGKCVVEKCER
jgi:DNA (cytosine-5)-methyltransferase 1